MEKYELYKLCYERAIEDATIDFFIKNPEKSNTIFAVENFATFALIFYLPVALSGKSQHNDGSIGAFGAFLLLTPILIIVIAACIYRNQSVYAELKE